MNLNAEGGDMLKQSITKNTGPAPTEVATLAAITLRSVKTNQRSRLVDRWFRFLLQQYKADEFLTIGIAKTYLSAYFAITTMGITDWNGMDDFYVNYKLDTTFDLIVRLVMLAFILATFVSFTWGFLIEEKVNSCPSPIIFISSHLRYINTYLVLPSSIWLYSKDLFEPEASIKDSGIHVFSWILISTSFAAYLCSIFMRSQLPTRGKLNSPNRMTEVTIFIIMSILMLLTRISTKHSFKNTLQTVSITLSCLAMFTSWFVQIFWWKSISNFYLTGLVAMNSVRIVIRVLQDSHQKPNFMEYLAYVAIFVAIFVRLAFNLTSHRLVQRIEASARTSNQENYVLYFSYDLCQEAEDAELSGRLPRGLLFYLSQTGRESSNKELSARQRLRDSKLVDNPYLRYTEHGSAISQSGKTHLSSAEGSSKAHDPLWAYYRTVSVSKPNSADDLFVYLLLQLIFLNKNLMTISPILLQYKKLLGSQAKSSLNLFLIESLLVGRLESLSQQEQKEASSSSRPTLSEIVSEITRETDNTMSEESTYFSKMRFFSNRTRKSGSENPTLILDLSRALTIKTDYLEAMCKVNKLIDVKSDIFTMLFEKYIHKSSFLYQKNKVARDVALELDQAFNVLLQNELMPNYVLATALSYYLKVRFDIQKTEKIFKIYQTRISRFHSLSLNPVKDITKSNFQFNSVVIKVNMAQDFTLGMISDISPNYSDFLGAAEYNDPTRVNINNLFPGKMAQTHVKMMKATADQPIFNVQKDFQLNGFDGILKPLRYLLKLDSSVSAGLHSMVLLKFQQARQKTLLLVDEQLDVVSAEQEFWQTLEALRCLPLVEKLSTLSDTLTLQIALMKFLKGSEEKVHLLDNENSTEPGNSHAGDGLVDAAGKVTESPNRADEESSSVLGSGSQEFSYQKLKHKVLENFQSYEESGILHVMSDQMRLPSGLTGLPFLATVEQTPFGREKYYRIWVTFDLNYNKEARNIKMMPRSPRASHYNLTMTGDPFMGKQQTVVNNKISDSDNNALGDGADTAGSVPAGIKTGIGAKEIAQDTFGFEHVLLKLKKTSPIVALIAEASQRNYPPEIKAALTWIQDFYKASEAAGEKNFLAQLEKARTDLRSIVFSDHGQGIDRSDIHRNSLVDRPARTTDALRVNTVLVDGATTPQASGIDNWGDVFNDQLKTQRGDINSAAFLPNSPREGSPNIQQYEFAKIDAPKIEKKFLRDPKNQVMPRQRGDKPEAKFISDNKEITKTDVRIVPIGKEQTQTNIKIEWADAKQPTTGTFGKTKSGVIHKGAKVIKVHPSGFHTLGSEKKSPTVKFVHEDGQPRKSPEELHENSGTEHKSTVFSQVLRKLFKYRNSRYLAGREEKDSRIQKKDELNPLMLQAASQQNQMTSMNDHNVQLISRYMSDFKLVRRAEHQPDAEKNASMSTKSTSSRGTQFIKIVNSTLQTKKKGDLLYFFTLGMAVFSIYFAVMFQTVSSTLNVYNVSNRNNFLLLSDFIFLDRLILQGVENQAYLFDHVNASSVAATYNTIMRSFNNTVPSNVTSYQLLSERLGDVVVDLKSTLSSILLKFTQLVDPKDSKEVAQAIYRQEEIQVVEDDGSITYTQIDYRGWLLYFLQKFGDSLTTLTDINSKAVASNLTYKFTARDQEKLELVKRTRYGSDRTVWNRTLERMGPVLGDIVDSIILSAVDRHFSTSYAILYVSIGVSVLMLIYNFIVSWKINQVQKEYLENYNLVRPWELFLMIDELGKQKTLFTQSLYHEMLQLSHYLEATLQTRGLAIGQKALLLEEQYAKDKEKTATNYKFSHNFTFFTSKFTFVFSFCGLVFYGLIGLTVYSFLSVNERRLGVENLLFDSHKYLLDVTKYYLSGTIVAMYGYYLPIAGTNVDDEVFVLAPDAFNIYQNQKRGEFLNYFGPGLADIVDDITFGDICSYIDKYQDLSAKFSDYKSLCLTLNANSSQNGINGFNQYLKYYISRRFLQLTTSNATAGFLNSSRTRLPNGTLITQMFTSIFNQARVGSYMLNTIYYTVMTDISTQLVNQIMQQLDQLLNSVIQSVVYLLYACVAAAYALALLATAHELEVCYEIFKLIDPFFLMNNRYLQFRFKAAFVGVE